MLEVIETRMSTGWRLFFGLGVALVGVVWIVRRHVPVGIEGRPPSFQVRGWWAVALGILVVALGLIIAFNVPRRLEIDSCLDQGGRFDYDKAQCDSPRSGQ